MDGSPDYAEPWKQAQHLAPSPDAPATHCDWERTSGPHRCPRWMLRAGGFRVPSAQTGRFLGLRSVVLTGRDGPRMVEPADHCVRIMFGRSPRLSWTLSITQEANHAVRRSRSCETRPGRGFRSPIPWLARQSAGRTGRVPRTTPRCGRRPAAPIGSSCRRCPVAEPRRVGESFARRQPGRPDHRHSMRAARTGADAARRGRWARSAGVNQAGRLDLLCCSLLETMGGRFQ